jgi:broad specificity phosphatase PhoE
MTGSERRLILVKHALPDIVAGVRASEWHLSDKGRRRCLPLAERLAAYQPTVVISSEEPKAVETGQIVAERLGLPCETTPGLHEHERPTIGFLGTHEQFVAQAVRLFEHPGELVFGSETADQAHARFAAAVAAVLAQHPDGNPVIVSHGTVITLLIARANGLDPVPFWKSLGLPAFAVLSLPGLRLLHVTENV